MMALGKATSRSAVGAALVAGIAATDKPNTIKSNEIVRDDNREVAPEDLERSFTRKKPWQRILVLLAGPGFNFAFAILILWGMLWVSGSPEIRPVVGSIEANSLAARAGLRPEDEILEAEGRTVRSHSDVMFAFIEAMSKDGRIELTVQGPGGLPRELEIRVEDAAARRAMTEPPALMPGLGMRFWTPPMPAIVGEVQPGGPADEAGLLSGDRILAVDGDSIADFPALVSAIAARPNRDVTLDVERQGSRLRLDVATTADLVDGQEVGRIRVQTAATPAWPPEMIRHRTFGPVTAMVEASVRAWDLTVLQAKMFARMLFGQVSLKNLSGPISIAEYAGESARSGVTEFLGFLIVISLSLGFLNLLPIPILDGGQIVYQLAEWVRGSPLPDRVQAFGQQLGIAMLLMLMSVAIFNDFARQLG